jgi:nitrate reductase beta subunit
MSLLTEVPPCSVSVGDGCAPTSVVVLDSEKCRDMRWCVNCGGEQVFVEVYEFESGRVGFCSGCGDERVVLFSRVSSQ